MDIFSNNKDRSAFEFKNKHTLDSRIKEASRIRIKYPNRIPVICEVRKSDNENMPLDKNKYLVPSDLTVGQFVYVIRKRIKLTPEKAIFVFINGNLPPPSSLMSQIYEEYKDDDGFLYMMASSESTFG